MRIAFPLYLITLLFPVIGSIPPPEEPLDLVIHRVAPRDSVLTDYLRQLILNHETDFDADYYLMDCTKSGFGDNIKVFHNERIAPFIDDHEFDAGIKYIKSVV